MPERLSNKQSKWWITDLREALKNRKYLKKCADESALS